MAFAEKSSDGVYNGVTAVDIVPAPAAAHTHVVRNITVYNADTVEATVSIYLNNNGTLRRLLRQPLEPEATLVYEVVQALDSTLKKITGTLSGGHTTTAPSFVATYADVS